MINSFVPYYFSDHALVIETSGEDVIDVDCVKAVGAEFAMSAFSGREANVAYSGDAEARNSELYVTDSKYALAAMPEYGFGNTQLGKSALAEDILRRCALPNITVHRRRLSISHASLEKFIVSRLASYMLNNDEVQQDAIEEARAVLEKDAAKDRHYYLIVKIDKETPEGKAALTMIKSYKSVFPDLIYINLPPSGRMGERERLLHRELPELISEHIGDYE